MIDIIKSFFRKRDEEKRKREEEEYIRSLGFDSNMLSDESKQLLSRQYQTNQEIEAHCKNTQEGLASVDKTIKELMEKSERLLKSQQIKD